MNAHARHVLAAVRATFPRVYAQHLATGEVFELTRGEHLSEASYAALVAECGHAWLTWQEKHPHGRRRPTAGRGAKEVPALVEAREPEEAAA